MKLLIYIALAVVLAATVAILGRAYDYAQMPQGHVIIACAEDDPCWNCLTMGNHRCGPLPMHGGA